MPVLKGSINGGAKIFIISLLQNIIINKNINKCYIFVSSKEILFELRNFFPDNNKVEFIIPKKEMFNKALFYLERLNYKIITYKNNLLKRINNNNQRNQSSRIRNIIKFFLLKFKILSFFIFILRLFGKLNSILLRALALLEKQTTTLDLLLLPFSAQNIRLKQNNNYKIVSIIYDFQHMFYPFFFSEKEVNQRNITNQWINVNANHVITISEETKNNFHNFTNYPLSKITSISIPIFIKNIDFQEKWEKLILKNKNLTEPYFVYPANFWPHKNHKLLFIALKMAVHKGLKKNIKLILIGNELNNGEEYRKLVKDLGLEKNVVFLGFVDENTKYIIIKKSFALIYPSLYEGFGMPLIESIILETPILCSDLKVIKEIINDDIHFFNPSKPKSIANSITEIVNNSEALLRLKEQSIKLKQELPLNEDIIKSYEKILFSKDL